MSNFIIGIDREDVYIGKSRSKGTSEVMKKGTAGSNYKGTSSDTRHIETMVDETDKPLVHKSVNRNVSLEIQRARQAKKMTQKELAQRISERPQVISDYESGRVAPSQQVLAKMERVLGVKLRGLK